MQCKGILLFVFVVDTGTPLSLSSFNNDRHCSYLIQVVANYTEIHVKSTCTWYDLDSGCVLVYNVTSEKKTKNSQIRVITNAILPNQWY